MQLAGSLLQEESGLRDSIALHRKQLHGRRLPVHVHQTNAASTMACNDLCCSPRISRCVAPAQCPDIVDDVNTEVQRRLHHAGLVGIDRYRHSQANSFAQYGQQSRQFFGYRYCYRAGSG